MLPGPVQPRDEVQIPVAEAERDAEVEERALEVDRPCRAAHVPAVAPAVAVRVPEVVRLPRVRREDDGDARGRAAPRDDERGVADSPVRGAQPQEVEPARPVPRPHHAQRTRSVAMRSPVDSDRARHRRAGGPEVLPASDRLARVVEDLEPQRGRVGRDPQVGFLARRVAAARELGLDALDADDGRLTALARPVHVHAPADREPEDVRARLGSLGRSPDDLLRACPEPFRRAPDRLRRASRMQRVRPQDVDPHLRRAIEPEADDRPVAEPVSVRRDGRQEPVVAGERTRAVRHLQRVHVPAGEERGQPEREEAHRLTVRIGTPSRLAANGTLDPWTTTEKSTTTKTIS